MEIIEGPTKKPVDDTIETVSQFEARIMKANSGGDKFIEVTEDVFNHYMKGQKSPYFFYHNIKVFKTGTRETIERLEAMLPEDRAREEAEMKKNGLEWT